MSLILLPCLFLFWVFCFALFRVVVVCGMCLWHSRSSNNSISYFCIMMLKCNVNQEKRILENKFIWMRDYVNWTNSSNITTYRNVKSVHPQWYLPIYQSHLLNENYHRYFIIDNSNLSIIIFKTKGIKCF